MGTLLCETPADTMGQSASRARNEDVYTPANKMDWDSYADAHWRSARARELDRFGGKLDGHIMYFSLEQKFHWCTSGLFVTGLERRPIARGNSVTAKLEFLQVC